MALKLSESSKNKEKEYFIDSFHSVSCKNPNSKSFLADFTLLINFYG